MEKPLHIFCCYAREDQSSLLELKKWLFPLQRDGLIRIYADIDINPGEEWRQKIDHHLKTAHIILLLISPDFVASEYCYSEEMKKALERHNKGEVCVIPIILRPVNRLQHLPFGKIQCLPTDAKPITKWPHFDDAFCDVAEGIQKIVELLVSPGQQEQANQSPPPQPSEAISTIKYPQVEEEKKPFEQEVLEQGSLSFLPIDDHARFLYYKVLFWRYFISRVLWLSLQLICQDTPNTTLAGLILPLKKEQAFTYPNRSEDLSRVGESLVGWIGQSRSFYTFLTLTPAFAFPSDFYLIPLEIMGKDKFQKATPKNGSLIAIQRISEPLKLSNAVVETVQRLLNQLYEEIHVWKPYFAQYPPDLVDPAINFHTNHADVILNGLANKVVDLGGRNADGQYRWRFCCILLPKDIMSPKQQRSLIVRAQSNSAPHKMGITIVSPDKYPGSSCLRALQSASTVYQPEILSTDTAIPKAEGPVQSVIALPIGGENGEPVAILYIVSDQKDAFSQADQRVLKVMGKIAEEAIRTYYIRQELAESIGGLIEEPDFVDTPVQDLL